MVSLPDQYSTTDRTKMKAFMISALVGLAAAAQVSHVSHVGHGVATHHGVAAHLGHGLVHAAPLAHAAHAAPVVVKEAPEPYTYTYGVADDYSKANFNAAE